MENFQESREKARKNLFIADHMVYMTYDVVNEPKILMLVMDNLFSALTNAITSVLQYERLFKRIAPFPDDFELKFSLFTELNSKRYNIEQAYMKMIRDIKEIITEHKKSPVEFSRQGKYVICNGAYRTRTITLDQIKAYVRQAKEFVSLTEGITKKNEEIFQNAS